MTRTTDDLHPEPFRGLGEKVTPPPPPPAKPEWTPVPDAPDIEQDRAGHLRTNIPGNEAKR